MRAGDRLIGLRSNDVAVATQLRAALGARVEPDYAAPPNLSLKLGTSRGSVQDFHLLYLGERQVLRTRSVPRLLQVALMYVDSLTEATTARLHARLLEREGIAVLVDGWLTPAFDSVERRVERLGYRVIDTAGVPIDPERGLVTITPLLPIAAIVVWNQHLEDAVSPAAQVIALARVAASPGRPIRESDLDLAVRIQSRCAVLACAAEGTALLDALAGLAAQEPAPA